MRRLSFGTLVTILLVFVSLGVIASLLIIDTWKVLDKQNYIKALSSPQQETFQNVPTSFELIENKSYFVQKNLPQLNHKALNEHFETVAAQFETQFKQVISLIPQNDYKKRPILTIHYQLNFIDEQYINVSLLASMGTSELAIWSKMVDVLNGQVLNANDLLFEKTPELTSFLYLNHPDLLDLDVNQLFENFTLTQDEIIFYQNQPSFNGYTKSSFPMEKISGSFRLLVTENGLKTNEQIARDNPLVSSGRKLVAFTFDDGPTPSIDKQILEKFNKFNGKATFFALGSRAEQFPETIDLIKSKGHEIANHSYSHADFTSLTTEQILNEVNQTSKLLGMINQPILIRPPYGNTNKLVLDTIPHPFVNWSVDSQDWRLRNAKKIARQILETVHNGAIILMHDLYQDSVDALDIVLPELASKGYEFVTVSQLYEEANQLLLPHELHYGVQIEP